MALRRCELCSRSHAARAAGLSGPANHPPSDRAREKKRTVRAGSHCRAGPPLTLPQPQVFGHRQCFVGPGATNRPAQRRPRRFLRIQSSSPRLDRENHERPVGVGGADRSRAIGGPRQASTRGPICAHKESRRCRWILAGVVRLGAPARQTRPTPPPHPYSPLSSPTYLHRLVFFSFVGPCKTFSGRRTKFARKKQKKPRSSGSNNKDPVPPPSYGRNRLDTDELGLQLAPAEPRSVPSLDRRVRELPTHPQPKTK